jgi:1,4-dihydroxy-2-naphthoate octaprenyltransferase
MPRHPQHDAVMTAAAQGWQGARPRTRPAAITPVAAGTGVAAFLNEVNSLRALLALIVALSFQVAVNYANDYSDGVRGTDDERVGPLRLTASGTATAQAVKRAALLSFAVGSIAGLVLVHLTEQWWLLTVGAASMAAAWFYTGGRNPYGYRGLGELSVFVFFGVVATVGSTYVQTLTVEPMAVVTSVGVGALACALLVVNNLRDIPTDRTTGKRTLAVRLGANRTRLLYVLLVTAALLVTVVIAVAWTEWALIALIAFIPAVPPVGAVLQGAAGRQLIPVLVATGQTQLLFGVLLALGLALS